MDKIKEKKLKSPAVYGMLVALGLVLSYAESQVPVFFAVPGMKLGLTNVLVVFAMYRMGWRSAACVNLLRIILVSVLFGNGAGFVYSLAGGSFSTLVMVMLKKSRRFSMTAVSMAGGVAHNAGQICAAMVMLGTSAVGWYFVPMWFAGIVSGILIGIMAGQTVKLVPDMN